MLSRKELLGKYKLLKIEMQKRGLKFSSNMPLDKALFKRAMIGIDVESLNDVTIIKDYISINGPFVKSSREATVVDVVIKDDEENRDGGLEEQISEAVQSETKKKCTFTYNKAGPPPPYIPLFDKIIRAKRETSKVEISKPETVKEYHRIPVKDCKITATIDISEKDGIKALYCGKEKEIATYLFNVDKFTMKEAKAWVNAHKKELQKLKLKNGKLIHEVGPAKSEEKIAKSVGGAKNLPLDDTVKWDAAAAVKRMRKLAGGPDKDNMDWNKYRRGFARYDLEDKENFRAYKLPFADVIDGKLTAIWGAIFRGLAALFGARGGVNVGDDKKAVYNFLGGYYKRFDKELPEFRKYEEAELKKMFPEEEAEKSQVLKLTFGKIDKKEHIVGGIIYEPDKKDTQGDEASAKEIWKALKNYMTKKKSIKVMHKGKAKSVAIVECFQAEEDTHKGGTGPEHLVKKGAWWLSIYLGDEPEIWKDVLAGKLNGFSMAGRASAST